MLDAMLQGAITPVLSFAYQEGCPFCAELMPRVKELEAAVPRLNVRYVDINKGTFPAPIARVPAFHLQIGSLEKTWEAGNDGELPKAEQIAQFVLKGLQEWQKRGGG